MQTNNLMFANFRCKNEYVEFRDGAARFSPLINRICQHYEAQDIETKDNFLFIKYFTDLKVPSNGFKLSVMIGMFFIVIGIKFALNL